MCKIGLRLPPPVLTFVDLSWQMPKCIILPVLNEVRCVRC